jgi:hypothetical protein
MCNLIFFLLSVVLNIFNLLQNFPGQIILLDTIDQEIRLYSLTILSWVFRASRILRSMKSLQSME